jgi:hypothetical protein
LPDPVIEQAAELYGVRYRPLSITAGQQLPNDLRCFDLITMFGVNLRLPDGRHWTWSEWEPFGRDLLSRLVPGGRLVLRPNIQTGPDIVLNKAQWEKIEPNSLVLRDRGQITITRKSV